MIESETYSGMNTGFPFFPAKAISVNGQGSRVKYQRLSIKQQASNIEHRMVQKKTLSTTRKVRSAPTRRPLIGVANEYQWKRRNMEEKEKQKIKRKDTKS